MIYDDLNYKPLCKLERYVFNINLIAFYNIKYTVMTVQTRPSLDDCKFAMKEIYSGDEVSFPLTKSALKSQNFFTNSGSLTNALVVDMLLSTQYSPLIPLTAGCNAR